jgi:ribosomal protein L1
MYAYKEILTLENPQQLNLSQPLPFLKGKTVEVLVIVEDDTDEIIADETDYILQNAGLMEQIALSAQTHQQHSGYQATPKEINEILSF